MEINFKNINDIKKIAEMVRGSSDLHIESELRRMQSELERDGHDCDESCNLHDDGFN